MNRKGFTVVEGLVLVAILAMITWMVLPCIVAVKQHKKETLEWKEQTVWMVPGSFAKVKLTGDKVQIRTACQWGITCLVASGRRYRDGLVSADSFKTEYVERIFKPHELEPWMGE